MCCTSHKQWHWQCDQSLHFKDQAVIACCNCLTVSSWPSAPWSFWLIETSLSHSLWFDFVCPNLWAQSPALCDNISVLAEPLLVFFLCSSLTTFFFSLVESIAAIRVLMTWPWQRLWRQSQLQSTFSTTKNSSLLFKKKLFKCPLQVEESSCQTMMQTGQLCWLSCLLCFGKKLIWQQLKNNRIRKGLVGKHAWCKSDHSPTKLSSRELQKQDDERCNNGHDWTWQLQSSLTSFFFKSGKNSLGKTHFFPLSSKRHRVFTEHWPGVHEVCFLVAFSSCGCACPPTPTITCCTHTGFHCVLLCECSVSTVTIVHYCLGVCTGVSMTRFFVKTALEKSLRMTHFFVKTVLEKSMEWKSKLSLGSWFCETLTGGK